LRHTAHVHALKARERDDPYMSTQPYRYRRWIHGDTPYIHVHAAVDGGEECILYVHTTGNGKGYIIMYILLMVEKETLACTQS
jgi:hypothetical protein